MIATTEISSRLLSRLELGPDLTDEMFELLAGHFEGASRTQFDRDLAEKNW